MLSEIMKQHRPVDVTRMRPSNFHSEVNKRCENVVDRVNSGNGWKDVPSCPVCSCSAATIEFRKLGIDLATCSNCHLRYHTKIPVNRDDVYNDPAFVKGSQGFWTKDEYNYRKERFGKERVEILANVVGDVKTMSILDVGCGSGYFSACAKEQGADCYGLEIAKDVQQWVSQHLSIEIFGKPLEQLETDIRFDVITAFDVIEHLERPLEFLLHAHRLLKNEGVIFVYTPNFDSFSIRVMKERSNLICPPSHLVLFNHKSLQYVLDKARFRVVYSATRGLDIADIISMFEADGKGDELFLETWKEELQAMIDQAGCGNSLRIIASK